MERVAQRFSRYVYECEGVKEELVFGLTKMRGNYKNSFFTPYNALTQYKNGAVIADSVVHDRQGKEVKELGDKPLTLSPLEELLRNTLSIGVKPLLDSVVAFVGGVVSSLAFVYAGIKLLAGKIFQNQGHTDSGKSLALMAFEVGALSVFLAVSSVVDPLDSLLRLLTHSMASLYALVSDSDVSNALDSQAETDVVAPPRFV